MTRTKLKIILTIYFAIMAVGIAMATKVTYIDSVRTPDAQHPHAVVVVHSVNKHYLSDKDYDIYLAGSFIPLIMVSGGVVWIAWAVRKNNAIK